MFLYYQDRKDCSAALFFTRGKNAIAKAVVFFFGCRKQRIFPLLLFFIFELSGWWSGRTKRRAAIREFLPLYAIPTQGPKKAAKRTGGARKRSANPTRRQEKQRGSKRNAPALQEPNPSQINMR